jgi:hypothetical protein
MVVGRLTVVAFHDRHNQRRRWRCRCECGAETVVASNLLVAGHTRSCGCLQRDTIGAQRRTHGQSGSREHRIWKGMLQRCRDTNATNYRNYGAKGITVCDRWAGSFESFLADVGPQPSPAHSLDRIDRARGYEPDNVRWATKTQQSRNQSNNHVIEHGGVSCTIAEWGERTGIAPKLIKNRLKRGWTIADALTISVADSRRRHS